jgi:hypothetical protein
MTRTGNWRSRHTPEVRNSAVRFFSYDWMPDGEPREVSSVFARLTVEMLNRTDSSPALENALEMLYDARNAFVRLVGEQPAAGSDCDS